MHCAIKGGARGRGRDKGRLTQGARVGGVGNLNKLR